ncbi:MAG TPA: RimK/LysX family protein [Patescibacteria group bacterium]|nr:RimK/LysX family protein [Patescibacteria group bacterium]
MKINELIKIGSVSKVSLPEYNIQSVPSRIDTGAQTSAIWASNIVERNGNLYFSLFDVSSPYFINKKIKVDKYLIKKIRSTSGHVESRYVVKLKIQIKGNVMTASFTLANRQKQKYPILIGRNIIRRKFIVQIRKAKKDNS